MYSGWYIICIHKIHKIEYTVSVLYGTTQKSLIGDLLQPSYGASLVCTYPQTKTDPIHLAFSSSGVEGYEILY